MDEKSANSKPDWWVENENLRRDMGLAEYDPPRFESGEYVHEVVAELESEYGCEIQFRSSVNPDYPEDWVVRLDQTTLVNVSRHRNEDGNTVYELAASTFQDMVESGVTEGEN